MPLPLQLPRPLCTLFLAAAALSVTLSAPAALAQQAPVGHAIAARFHVDARNQVASRIDPTRRVAINGVLHSTLATATDNGALPPDAPLDHLQLQLNRPAARQAALDQLIDALHTPGSPSFHQWLTPSQVGQNFGPSQSDIDSLTGWLQSQGFTINMVSPGGLSIDFAGTHAQFAATFGTDFHRVTLANGETHTSVLSDPQIPDAFAALVPGFVSLSDIGPRSTLVHTIPNITQKAYANGVSPLYTSGPNPNYYLGPQDFYTIYSENALLSAGTPINGSGRTIGIVAASNIVLADVTAFRNNFGVSPATPASLVLQHGSTSVSCTDPGITASEDEVILDTEWAGAVAPSASLLVMSCASGGGYNGIQRAAMAMIDDNLVDIIDVSYGFYEAGLTSGGVAYYSNLWEQAAAEGITVVVSAGDSGAATQDQNTAIATHGINVNGLGSSNYNVSAGGTDFQDTFNSKYSANHIGSVYWNATQGSGVNSGSAKGYVPETAWNGTCASSLINYFRTTATEPTGDCNAESTFNAPAGGGGGVSIYNALPAWQNITLAGLPTNTNRMMPDVSLFASSGPWGHALLYYQSDGVGLGTAGGTSFVAPQLAGVFALVAQKTGQRLGQPNYILYNMAAVEYNNSGTLNACNGSGTTNNIGETSTAPASTCIFNDVTTGNISQGCTAGTPNCYNISPHTTGILSLSGGTDGTGSDVAIYPATQGWDYATGLGSINITNLVNKWQTAISGGTTFTPTITLTPASLSATYGASAGAASLVATVSGTGSFPTGNVAFSGSPTIGAIGTVALAQSSGCASGGTCTETATQSYTSAAALPAATYTITSNYNSTNENYAAASTSFSFIVAKQTPTLTISATPTVTYGSTSTFTASLAYTGAGVAPTGAVTFSVDGGAPLTATCTGSSSPLSCTYTGGFGAGASHTLDATYAADTNYNTASAAHSSFVVSKQSATLVIAATPTFNYGHSSTLTANLSWSAGSAPTSAGNINFSVDGSGPLGASCSGSTSPITCTFTFGFTGGTHTIDASFAGDTNFSTATATQSSFTVNKQSPTPSANTITTVTYGSNSSLSGTVSYTGNGVAPTGAVTFSVDSGSALTATCTGSSSPLSCTYSGPFNAGSHTTTMSVAADTNYNATTIPGNGFTVSKQTPTLVIAATSTVTYGSSSHLTANLSWSAGSAPTSAGTINFSIDGSGPLGAACSGSTSPITCTFTFAFTGGTHTVNASFAGDTNFSAASATQSTFTVNKATPPVSVTASPTSSLFGDTVTFTAHISGIGATGTATFSDNGTPISGSATVSGGAPILEPSTLSVHPQSVGATATFSTNSLAVGSHTITTAYSGDSNYNSASSSSISFVVSKATPTITWVPSTLAIYKGNTVGGGVLNATGSVAGTITYTATPSVGSTVAITAVSLLPVDTYTITATLTPSAPANYNNATASIAFTVKAQNIWVVNSNGTLSAVDDGGNAVSSGISGAGAAASAVAFDGNGNVWSLNSANNAVVEYTNTGAAVSTSPGYTGGGINAPTALAIDGNGTAWVTNANGSVSAVASPGFTLTPSAGYTGGNMSSPTGIAVDSSGNLWISNGNNSITEFVGTAAPVVSPLSTAVKTNTLGVRP